MGDNVFETNWRNVVPMPTGLHRIRQDIRSILLSTAGLVKPMKLGKSLRLLYCHYVFDDQKREFESVITKLKNIGEFIDTDTCIQMLEGKKKIDKNYFHLSFDDGFRNIYTNAFPIIKKHNIPAIFFVPTSIISSSYKSVKNYCVNTVNKSGVIEMASWEDLKDLQKSGIDIGSHTRTHARFSEISQSPARLQDEIEGSKFEIEDKLGAECKYISWPYGKLDDADMSSLEQVKKSGYSACFGAYRGQIIPGITNKFSVPRHHFESQWPWLHIKFFAQGGMEKN